MAGMAAGACRHPPPSSRIGRPFGTPSILHPRLPAVENHDLVPGVQQAVGHLRSRVLRRTTSSNTTAIVPQVMATIVRNARVRCVFRSRRKSVRSSRHIGGLARPASACRRQSCSADNRQRSDWPHDGPASGRPQARWRQNHHRDQCHFDGDLRRSDELLDRECTALPQ